MSRHRHVRLPDVPHGATRVALKAMVRALVAQHTPGATKGAIEAAIAGAIVSVPRTPRGAAPPRLLRYALDDLELLCAGWDELADEDLLELATDARDMLREAGIVAHPEAANVQRYQDLAIGGGFPRSESDGGDPQR